MCVYVCVFVAAQLRSAHQKTVTNKTHTPTQTHTHILISKPKTHNRHRHKTTLTSTYTHRRTHTDAHRHTHRRTHTQTHTHTHTQMHTHPDAHTHPHTDAHTQTHTHRHTNQSIHTAFLLLSDIPISKIIVHAEFNKPNPVEHDIALIKLARDVDFSGAYAGPACMPNADDDYHGAEGCWLSGTYQTNRFSFAPNSVMSLRNIIRTSGKLKRWISLRQLSKFLNGINPLPFFSLLQAGVSSGPPETCPTSSKSSRARSGLTPT